VAVIPRYPCRAGTRKTDWCLYKERARIEGLFGTLRRFRRVFSRFDKLARRNLSHSFISAVCILVRRAAHACR
jgi:hypothetical protein